VQYPLACKAAKGGAPVNAAFVAFAQVSNRARVADALQA
jgi:hypothetical protein